MITLPCRICGCETQFVSITGASQLLEVCRSTVYYWIERDWVHWCELPSGRRLLCVSSLRHYARAAGPTSSLSKESFARQMSALGRSR